MKKLVTVFILILSLSFAAYSQPKMTMKTTTHDYGNITQEAGIAYYEFEFKNTGNKPIIINNAEASCGCTEPTWVKSPILPNKSSKITVGYDPNNSPGHFSKTITVYSNAQNSPIELKILGNVVEKQNFVDEEFPKKIGELRLDKNYLNLGNVENTKVERRTINIYNPTSKKMNIKIKDSDKPAYIKIEQISSNLAPKTKGTIVISYNVQKVNDWDLVESDVYLTINNSKIKTEKISITATIREKFSAASKANPPKIQFTGKTLNFGNIKISKTTSKEIQYKNIGTSELIIRKITSNDKTISGQVIKNNIAPNGSGSIKFNLTPQKLGRLRTSVYVITNSPVSGFNKVILRVNANVIK